MADDSNISNNIKNQKKNPHQKKTAMSYPSVSHMTSKSAF